MRQIVKDDWPFVASCLREIKRESPAYSFGDDGAVNADRVRQYFKAALDAGIMFGCIEPEKGFMFGCKSVAWYDPRNVEAFEQLLYVRQPYRGGILAGKLIKGWENLARSLGVTKAFAGATMDLNDDKVIRLYRKLGWSISKQSVEKQLNVYSGT